MSNQSQDDYVSIDTPENVAFGYKVAGIGSRFLAALVDTLLIFLLQLVALLALVFAVTTFFSNEQLEGSSVVPWLLAIFGLISFAFLWGYYILFEMLWNGQSPGKRWVGLRVIKTDGTPVTLAESIIRNLIRLVDFLPAYYGVGVVTMFINQQSRRLGDLAAGTLVVHDRTTITLESLAARPAAQWLAPSGPASTRVSEMPLERLTEHDLQIAEEFLRRQTDLANRSALAGRILQALLDRMDVRPEQVSGMRPESLIADIVQAHRNRAAPPPT
jgi:uncharacterized RDD family membrane protein YckC